LSLHEVVPEFIEEEPDSPSTHANGTPNGRMASVTRGISGIVHGASEASAKWKDMGGLTEITMSKAHALEHIESLHLTELGQDNLLRRAITDPIFEWICACVIITNAVTIGISANLGIIWALENPGKPLTTRVPAIDLMNKVYVTFYTTELILKIIVWRCEFFIGRAWRWNLFDFLLVLSGLYDLMTELTDLGGGMSMTWLRVLRIVKTLKLLRVIRVMRFFQVLRLMVSAISGSMGILFWSILMISIMMYMFGLCFLNACTAYLNDNDSANVDPEVFEGIEAYYSSVLQSMITLFWAVTGGSDWEVLAAPIRTADPFFYSLFFFYIAFAALAVLNVLTGMFVDTAMKVAQQDQENVAGEMLSLPQVDHFRQFVEQKDVATPGCISAEMIAKNQEDPIVESFKKVLEISEEDFKRVFTMMDAEKRGLVDLEEFIKGCCHANGGVSGLDVVFMMTQMQHMSRRLDSSVEFMEERLNELLERSTHSKHKTKVVGWETRMMASMTGGAVGPNS